MSRDGQMIDTTPSYKKALHDAFRLLEAFRELRPDMPMQTASVFFLVAMKPGIGQRELLDLMDLSQAAISRNTYALMAIDRHGKPGLNLIVQHRNPADGRNTMLYLTPEGNAFLARLMAIGRPQRSTDQT
ncbi:winged helix-turn-helix transcriptional regulator [Rhizobium wenxiniae]|uniref:MarR family winged helix-turn-helix transcriptional regulator n=1 Tax=Rhizobium wenxiniae TaxID=1737357 RepID=UPI001C6E0F8E|nr:MarR family winged helix-turn-helix transcriptional regulator [Rhizobium wenxiniae]MBW9091414.1 winged helix-turn-helix transcriptional regulator [Rhizobium wenxiniae]